MRKLKQEAIQAALNSEWGKAIGLNLDILRENPNDIQTLNRLAKAYMELDQKEQAKKTYQKVLELDKYNQVARKNLAILPEKNPKTQKTADEDFIETPKETKTVQLIKAANKNVLAELYVKQPLKLKPQGKLVQLYTNEEDTKKIGALPDDLSFKIKKLLEKDYEYSACIKSVDNKDVSIFLRETNRPEKYADLPSFSKQVTYQLLKD